MAPIKKFSAGCISCALWENEATVEGRKVDIHRVADVPVRVPRGGMVGLQAYVAPAMSYPSV
jgi:hypothetical protein